MRQRDVGYRLDFSHVEHAKIDLPLMESVQRVVIRAEILRRDRTSDRSSEHPAQRRSVDDAAAGRQRRGFVIADIKAKSIRQELVSIVEQLPSLPVQPILHPDGKFGNSPNNHSRYAGRFDSAAGGCATSLE
jgi:hypothetical protein